MVVIDLNAPTISPAQRVWRLFPGKGYQFQGDFIENGVGYLDFPGLELPEGDLTNANDFIPRIARSQAIKEAIRSREPVEFPRLEEFAAARNTKHRGSLRSAIINFFQEAKAWDLVVLPEPAYNGRIWIGQFTDDDLIRYYHVARFGGYAAPARRLRWYGPFAENTVSTSLSSSLRKSHPFTLLEKARFLEVFSLVYTSFVFGDRYSAAVFNDDDFLDADAAFLGNVSRLAAAACRSIDENEASIDRDALLSILISDPPIEYTSSQEIDIHSPGFNRYTSATIVSLVIAAVVATYIGLSEQSSHATLANDIAAIQYVNSAAGADPGCTARVSEASKRILDVLGIDKTWKMCEAAKSAKRRAGLRSSARPRR